MVHKQAHVLQTRADGIRSPVHFWWRCHYVTNDYSDQQIDKRETLSFETGSHHADRAVLELTV